MIVFEHGMLVLDNSTTKEDVAQIDSFAEYVRNQERERIIKLLETEATRESDYCTLPIDPKHCSMCWHYERLIALIKEENK